MTIEVPTTSTRLNVNDSIGLPRDLLRVTAARAATVEISPCSPVGMWSEQSVVT